jgi:hypothetical protein
MNGPIVHSVTGHQHPKCKYPKSSKLNQFYCNDLLWKTLSSSGPKLTAVHLRAIELLKWSKPTDIHDVIQKLAPHKQKNRGLKPNPVAAIDV